MGMENQTEILWGDRKRYCGMPLSCEVYAVTEDRLLITEGLLHWSQKQVHLRNIRDIFVKRSFVQRLWGVGSVIVKTYDEKTYVLEDIRDPVLVKELIFRKSEAQKRLRWARGGDFVARSDWWSDLFLDRLDHNPSGLLY